MSQRNICLVAWIWGLCFSLSGCCVYPFVKDVTGPVRGVRVLDSELGQDIPDAQASFNISYDFVNESETSSTLRSDVETISQSGLFGTKNGLRDGNLTRGQDGVFRVSKWILPGVGIAGISFADGPGYFGPLSKHGECGYVAVITAWAPEHKLLQVAYHAPLFAKFDFHEYWDYRSNRSGRCEYGSDGILKIYLDRGQPDQKSELTEVLRRARSQPQATR